MQERKYTDEQLRHMASFPTLEEAGRHYGISRQAVRSLLSKHLDIRRHEDYGLLSTKEVAYLLGMSPSTVKLWRRKQTGPPFLSLSRVRTRYRLEDVLIWARRCEMPVPGLAGRFAERFAELTLQDTCQDWA